MFETIVGVVGTALSVVSGWTLTSIVGLGSRVAVLEQRQTDALPLLDAKLDRVVTLCEQLEKRLERVERSMNGHLQRGDQG